MVLPCWEGDSCPAPQCSPSVGKRLLGKGASSFQTLTCFVLGVIKLHVESVTVVDDPPGRHLLVGKNRRLQRGVVKHPLGVDVNRGLALAIGNGEVLEPVLGS